MTSQLARVFPLLYGVAFLVLLWQAIRVMSRGFAAASIEPGRAGRSGRDRTGRLTVHPELLDEHGRLTDEDLLTVRFDGEGGDSDGRPSGAPTSEV
jgi:hypothetical protein